MKQCRHCEGFLPPGASVCPHCDELAPRNGRAEVWMLSATFVTLMACYGGGSEMQCRSRVDRDKDGASICEDPPKPSQSSTAYFSRHPDDDCDDDDPARRPGVPDPVGDGIDQNCDWTDGITSASVSARGELSISPTAPPATSLVVTASASPSGPAGLSASTKPFDWVPPRRPRE